MRYNNLLLLLTTLAVLSSCNVIGTYELQNIRTEGSSRSAVVSMMGGRQGTIELEFGGTMVYNQWYSTVGGCCSGGRSYCEERVGYWKKRGDTLMLEFTIGEWSSYRVNETGDSLFPIYDTPGVSNVYVRK